MSEDRMTAEQWSALTARLNVPAAAREQIENKLDLYRRVGSIAAKRDKGEPRTRRQSCG
jgi:hypothetical protein